MNQNFLDSHSARAYYNAISSLVLTSPDDPLLPPSPGTLDALSAAVASPLTSTATLCAVGAAVAASYAL